MTNVLYILPWILWVLWFVAWEAWGFRKGNDKWPTLSQLVKWWESSRKVIPTFEGPEVFYFAAKRGIAAWSWRRWLVAVGIPALGVYLELHWVWEVF